MLDVAVNCTNSARNASQTQKRGKGPIMDMRLIVVVTAIAVVVAGPMVFVALGPLWSIAIIGFAVLWAGSAIAEKMNGKK